MEIQKKQDTALANTKPRGFEEPIDRNDLLIPRAKKLESLSPEVTDDSMTPGLIINSVTKEVLPEEFTPIFFFKQWIRFNPRKDTDRGYDSSFGPGDIIYRTNNANDPRLQTDGNWEGQNPPLATAFLNFFSLFKGVDFPVIVSFCNTNYKTGKTLLSLAQFTGGDMFSKTYKLTTKKTKNDQGTFYVFDVKLSGNTDSETLKRCIALYDSFRSKDLEVHQEQEQDKVPF